MKFEIERLVHRSEGERDERTLRQAVRDAAVCKESRQSRDSCGCFCCELDAYLRSAGYETHKIVQGNR
jgi:hypothetical protein